MRSHALRLVPALPLLAVPVLLLVLRAAIFPPAVVHTAYGDPDHGYLLNSLMLVTGQVPSHVDHPGTPVQLLGAWVIRGLHAWRADGTDVVGSVLLDPYSYLALTSLLLVLLLAASVLAFGVAARRAGVPLPWVLVLQTGPLWLPDTWLYLFRVSPEILSPAVGMLIAALFLSAIHSVERTRFNAVLLGGLIGLGLSLKMTFLPLSAFLLHSRLRRSLHWGGSALVASFFLITWPVRSQYGRIFGWLNGIATHSGTYGQGGRGVVPDWQVLLANVRYIFEFSGAYFLLAFLFPLAMAAVRFSEGRIRAAFQSQLLLCAAVVLLQLLLVVKHLGTRYLLPSVAAWVMIASMIFIVRVPWRVRSGILVAALIVIGLSLREGWIRHQMIRFGLPSLEAHSLRFLRATGRYSHCSRVYAAPLPLTEFGLYSGDMAANHVFTKRLQELYPATIFYDAYPGHFRSFGEVMTNAQVKSMLARRDCSVVMGATDFLKPKQALLFVGGGRIEEAEVKTPFTARELYREDTLGIFSIAIDDALQPLQRSDDSSTR